MKLIIGLGNPGAKYKNSRHNAGFMLVDKLEKLDLPEVELFKPQKFMNRSGAEVKRWLRGKWKGRTLPLYVAHDDLDIPLGKFKIQLGKGPKVHNGLQSIYEQLGTKNFWHVRIGTDSDRGGKTPEEFVLSNFRPEEREVIDGVIEKIIKELNG